MNKVDLLPPASKQALLDSVDSIHISAAKGVGLSTLLERVDETLSEDPVRRVQLRVPQKEGKVLAMLEARARIYGRDYRDGLVELEAEAPESVVRQVQPFVIQPKNLNGPATKKR